MAEQIIQVTEGAGKKLHTFDRVIGANTVNDEIVLLGHPYEAEYFADPAALSNPGTAANHMIQIMAGSSLNVYVHRIWGTIAGFPGAVTDLQIQMRRLTSAGTGGSAMVISPIDSVDAAAGAAGMTMPTVKGTEGVVLGDGHWSWPAASPAAYGAAIAFDFDFRGAPHLKPLRIPAGTSNGLCVKNVGALATASCLCMALITEANF